MCIRDRDKAEYSRRMRQILENQEHLVIKQAEVCDLLWDDVDADTVSGKAGATKKIRGVRTFTGTVYEAKAVILCTGTYLKAVSYTHLDVYKRQDYIRVKVDTEDYRKRRKETLENLAKNIAYKVKRSRRPVALEPMNPYERRIIHSALQNDKYVTTHSEGEEPYRHVVVTLKKNGER